MTQCSMWRGMTNLLTNAAKLTPESGRIEIGTARKNGDATIQVKDNGARAFRPMPCR
jgi:signal transduction histidine kinase